MYFHKLYNIYKGTAWTGEKEVKKRVKRRYFLKLIKFLVPSWEGIWNATNATKPTAPIVISTLIPIPSAQSPQGPLSPAARTALTS